MTEKPIHKIKIGSITLSVWNNKLETGDKVVNILNVTLQRCYKDKNEDWKNVNSFTIKDIPKIQLALSKLYEDAMFNKIAAEIEIVKGQDKIQEVKI